MRKLELDDFTLININFSSITANYICIFGFVINEHQSALFSINFCRRLLYIDLLFISFKVFDKNDKMLRL